jgi:beta-lactamase regulating signal transducer with metallopeptidase domain
VNHTILIGTGAFSASGLVLMDSAVRGMALLVVAAVAAMILRRDSAATRHLVWLLAMVALLGVPVLTAVLPRWRVLPEWARMPTDPAVLSTRSPVMARPANGAIEVPLRADPEGAASPSATAYQPAAGPPGSRPTSAAIPPSALGSWGWLDALPVVWAMGSCVFILRLIASRWMLGKIERQATVIGPSEHLATIHLSFARALEAACSQFGVRRSITLLFLRDRTIPLVWGILRYRLLLPAAARHWSDEQLRSVLLHELAHIKRRDTMSQPLAQIACALHWFNPLVWLAAWRLGVECERACDDLVLASGVRPSAYAGHLLEVVTGFSSAGWTQAGGLAMARKSSLERRLVAVLSHQLNRRGVSAALTFIAIVIAVGIVVPIAMLRAAEEKSGEKPKPAVTAMKPKHEYAQALFGKWQANARTDGKIPGALIGQVAREVDNFVKQYPQDEKAPQLAALRPRLDASHDWTQADVVVLLDDLTAISTGPVGWADFSMEFDEMQDLKRGQPLPVELTTAAWGLPVPNGLRAAWLLEPRAEQYAEGSVLKARVLFHNTGKNPVVFMTETWHQNDRHTARDSKGAKITVSGAWYTGETPTATYRLAPGEYCEVTGHGVAIGAGKYEEEFSTGSVGAVIEAKEGDEVTLTQSVDTTYGDWTRPDDPKDPAELWNKSIAERVEREAPMPQGPADREQLIRRVTLDLFGEAASAEEVAAFVDDYTPDSLAKLTARLQAKPRIERWAGKLPTGETRFRVLPADPNAAKAPRAANSAGRYVLDDRVHLLVSSTIDSRKRANSAQIVFLSPDPKSASPHEPYEIALPDGLGTYGLVWERGAGVLWLMQQGLVLKYDFRNPSQVQETRFEPGGVANVPEPLRGALGKVFDAPATSR